MIVTINTDASFGLKHMVGGYAFYIVCNKGKMLKSGPIKKAKNPMDCEMKAIANALYLLKKSDFNNGKISKIIINSDCLHSFKYIKSYSEKYVGGYIWKTIDEINKTNINIDTDDFYDLRHVKAHNGTPDARSWVNDWCDKQAKIQMRKQIRR